MIRRLVTIIGVGFLAWAVPTVSRAATLYLSPSSGTYSTGQTFSASVRVNTGGQAINAAEGTLAFPTDLLEVTSLSKSGSVFSLWPSDPSASNSTGKISYSGGVPSPGYTGSSGKIFTITFKVKSTGTAAIAASSGKILANDGQGTNILTGQSGGTFTLSQTAAPAPAAPAEPAKTTPTLSSSTHPNQDAWYRDLQASLTFSQPTGLLGVSFGLTDQPDSVPDEVPDPTDGTIQTTIPNEGVWYFHIRGWYSNGWSSTAHYRFQIDRSAPDPFSITLDRDRDVKDATPTLKFMATDALSGIDHYTLRLNGDDPEQVESPVTLALTNGGPQTVVITAYDRAGNTKTSQLDFDFDGYPPPIITGISQKLILLQPITVDGTAASGDTVTIYLDGEVLGTVQAGRLTDQGAVVVRVPWHFQSQRLLVPGKYSLTATATSADGMVSVPTDPKIVHVSGTSLIFNGYTLATIAIAPALAGLLIVLLVANSLVYVQLFRAVKQMHSRELQADRDVRALAQRLESQRLSPSAIKKSLQDIERDLEEPAKPVKKPRRRKS